jgi:hypothetical protein
MTDTPEFDFRFIFGLCGLKPNRTELKKSKTEPNRNRCNFEKFQTEPIGSVRFGSVRFQNRTDPNTASNRWIRKKDFF